jgi:hypothetical protein
MDNEPCGFCGKVLDDEPAQWLREPKRLAINALVETRAFVPIHLQCTRPSPRASMADPRRVPDGSVEMSL